MNFPEMYPKKCLFSLFSARLVSTEMLVLKLGEGTGGSVAFKVMFLRHEFTFSETREISPSQATKTLQANDNGTTAQLH